MIEDRIEKIERNEKRTKNFTIIVLILLALATTFFTAEIALHGFDVSKLMSTGFFLFEDGKPTENSQLVALTFTSEGTYELAIDNSQGLTLASLKLDGQLIGTGDVEAYLASGGQRYLILDAGKIAPSNDDLITGSSAGSSATEEQQALPSQQETTNSDGSITTTLAYNTGTRWDADNDGIAYTEADAVDLKVSGTTFGFEADRSKICTKWTILSASGTETKLCNGAADCCALNGLAPNEESWDATLYIYYEQHETTKDNIVTAQVLYINQQAEEGNTTFESYIGEPATLPVKFTEPTETRFSDVCAETCILPEGLDKDKYTIEFNVEPGTILNIDKITYILKQNTVNQNTVNETQKTDDNNATIDVTPSVRDSKGNALSTNIEFIDLETKEKSVHNTQLHSQAQISKITLRENKYKIKIDFNGSLRTVRTIELNDAVITNATTELIKAEDIDNSKFPQFLNAYAIDPTQLNFTTGTVTAVAVGTELYKCKEWDFLTQTCNGEWKKLMALVPGQEYSFTITPEDPAYSETMQPSMIDTYVNEQIAGANYGTATNIDVQIRSGRNRRLFLMFNLSNISNTAKIKSANLSIYKYGDSTTSRTFNINRVTGPWTETGATWTNQPTVAATPTSTASVSAINTWYKWDVTGDVKNFVNSTYTNYGWRINDATEGGSTVITSNFYSREYSTDTSLRPKLDISYEVDEGPTTGLVSPEDSYNDETPDYIDLTFNCSATDDYQLKNISLYITNNQNESFSLNKTTSVTGTSAWANWTLSLAIGDYTWNCLAYDNASNSASAQQNRTVKINYPFQPVVGFSVTLPGQAPVNASESGNVTAQMVFNSTQNTYYGMNPCVGPTVNCQNSTTPFFTYLNTGNVNLTLNLSLDSALPSVFALRYNTIFNNNTATTLSPTPITLVSDLLPGTTQNAFFFGDFIDAHPANTTTRNLTSSGGQT